MIRGGIEFDEDVLAGRKQPTEAQLTYMAHKLVKEFHRIRRKCKAELEFQQSIIRVADTHHDIISKDPYLLRRFESLKKTALKQIQEYEGLLQRLKADEVEILGAAQWARRQLKEGGQGSS